MKPASTALGGSGRRWGLCVVLVAAAIAGTLCFVDRQNPDCIEVQVTLRNPCGPIDEVFMRLPRPAVPGPHL